jgi:sugar phosphate isomerase/epimerase
MKQIPIALQLYTVRGDAEQDLTATLADVAAIGYTNVELAGFYGLTSAQIKAKLEKFGLKPVAAHVGLSDLEGDKVGKTIENYLNLGVEYLVVSHIGEDIRKGGSGYADAARRLNAAGETLSSFGLKVGYHDHDFEFKETFEGKAGIEILIENTDPSLVTFELDTYWADHAGVDPVAFIKKHGSRLALLHIKDIDPDDRSFAPIGTGLLPLAGIVEAGVAAGTRYLIVEQDITKGPALEAIKISLDNLKAKGYA